MIAVLGLGLHHLELAGDEHRVIAPHVEQPVLPERGGEVNRLTRRTINRSVACLFFGCEGNTV